MTIMARARQAAGGSNAPDSYVSPPPPDLHCTLTHDNFVRSVAVTSDGRYAATSAFDDTFRLWELATGKEVRRWEVPGRNTVVAITPDGAALVGGNADGELLSWSLETGEERWARLTRQGWAYDLSFTPDGQQIASANHASTVSLWNSATGANLCHLKGHQQRVWCVAFSPDGKFLASGAEDSLVLLWDVKTRTQVRELRGHKKHVSGVAFSPDGRRLVSVEVTDTLRERGEKRPGGQEDRMILWDVESGQAIISVPARRMSSLAFSPDGQTIVTGDHFGQLHVWNAATGAGIHVLEGHDGAICGLAFSRDGARLVSASEDGTARVWGLAVPEEEATAPESRHPSVALDLALLRAIQGNPDDDAPRLAAADWLEQQGDVARAELIRVQCALAHPPEDEEEKRRLSQRE